MKARRLEGQAQLDFFRRGVAAQEAVDELLQVCWCGHVKAAHIKTGHCSEADCDCIRFSKGMG